jgi:hypothetical protein
MSREELEGLLGLLGALRAHGVTKYETTEMCLELALAPIWPVAAGIEAGGPEETDFDPGKAYQDSIEQAAKAIAEAAAKRE